MGGMEIDRVDILGELVPAPKNLPTKLCTDLHTPAGHLWILDVRHAHLVFTDY
jgi:hypothetical protein